MEEYLLCAQMQMNEVSAASHTIIWHGLPSYMEELNVCSEVVRRKSVAISSIAIVAYGRIYVF